MVAVAARDRREPAFAGFLPPPSHPLRRHRAEGPTPLATEGIADPGPGDRREPLLGALQRTAPHPLRREPFYRRPQDLPPLRGPAGSLALHVLIVVLIVIGWRAAPPPAPPPIPVTLVVEKPPQAPAQPPAPPPVHGPLASEDIGEVAPKAPGPKMVEAPPAPTPPAAPPVPPAPQASLVPPPPAAAPTPLPLDLPQVAEAVPLPKPKPPPPPQPPARVVSRPAAMSLPRARIPGPAATRDEYLAYCQMLIQRHRNLLSSALAGNRRGEAVVGFLVHDDGTITEVHVVRTSGYPDIDSRVEEMVVAVGRFPPLPQWFQGDAFQFTLYQTFPPRSQQ